MIVDKLQLKEDLKIHWYTGVFELGHSLLHHVVVDKLWHDRDGDSARALSEHRRNLLIFESNHVLAVHFCQIVVCQNTIAGGGGGGGGGGGMMS